ncbi:hypothetical protein D3C77_506900 [compost metagenome]
MLLRLVLVKEPELTGHGARIEEIATDVDHGIDMAGFHELLTHLRVFPTRAGSLRGHDKACPPLIIQVAVEVLNPKIVCVRDFLGFVNTWDAKRQAWIVFDFLSIHLVHVEGWIRHNVIDVTPEFFMGIVVVGDGLLAAHHIAFETMNREVHFA